MRMSESYFSLKSIDERTKTIHLQGTEEISWMLWETEFKVNSYHTISSYENFTTNINEIVSYEHLPTFYGTISETKYASGNNLSSFRFSASAVCLRLWTNRNCRGKINYIKSQRLQTFPMLLCQMNGY